MLSTSNFWGFKAAKSSDQSYIPGTSKWVSNEMNEANKLILQSSKYFSSLVKTELVWLNEQMADILEGEENSSVDSILLLRSPAKLISEDSPVRKIRQEAINDLANSNKSAPVANKNAAQSEVDNKIKEKAVILEEIDNAIPMNAVAVSYVKNYHNKNESNIKDNNLKEAIITKTSLAHNKTGNPSSEVSLMLRSAEKLAPIEYTSNLEANDGTDSGHKNFDESFEAIAKTIKLAHTNNFTHAAPELVETVGTKPEKDSENNKSSTITGIQQGEQADSLRSITGTIHGSNSSKLPSTTPIADRLSLFASLPPKEPLSVRLATGDATNSEQNLPSISPSENAANPVAKAKTLYPSIYPPLSNLKPLMKSMLDDHRDEDSPFKIATKDWVPPSPKRVDFDKNEQNNKESKSKNPKNRESALNSIFADALKRARTLMSPSRTTTTSEAPSNTTNPAQQNTVRSAQTENSESHTAESKSVKKVVASKAARGNLMDRLTADTESSAARLVPKFSLQPTSRLYPEAESPLSKRRAQSPLTKQPKLSTPSDLAPLPSRISIPSAPVFKPKAPSPAKAKISPKSPVTTKRKLVPASPDKIITKEELSHVNGHTIAQATAELQKKRLKGQESLTSLPLNKTMALNRKSNASQRINKRMAEERARVEEIRKQRLSASHKIVSLDEQLIRPLQKAREKSLKAIEQPPSIENVVQDKIQLKKPEFKVETLRKSNPLMPLSEESMNKRRKTEEKMSHHQKSMTGSTVSTPSTTSTAARTQRLMKTAMAQQSRLSKTAQAQRKESSSKGTTHTTPLTQRGAVRSTIMTSASVSPMALPEIFSEPEDDEEGHVLKDWAASPELKKLLYKQQNVNPDQVFGPIPPLNMDDIFKTFKTAKFRARSSSAHWGAHDMLSAKEADEYTKRMGWKR